MALEIEPPSKKRKLSDSVSTPAEDDEDESTHTSRLIRGSISTLTRMRDLPSAFFLPLLQSLTASYESALVTEEVSRSGTRSNMDNWNWEIPVATALVMDDEDQQICKELMGCREKLQEYVS